MANFRALLTDGRWAHRDSVSVCGHAFYEGRLRSAAEICQCLAGVDGPAEFERQLRKMNGFFAVVSETADGVLAAVDRVRSIPLFFSFQGSSLCLSDRATALTEGDRPIPSDVVSREEFRLTGFVCGPDTLWPGIGQIQAGEMLMAATTGGKLSVSATRYFRFAPRGTSPAPPEQLQSQLNEVVTGCIDRLMAHAAGRTVVLPLSGGWDSRLIATMLRKLGYDNVLCFSYGRPGNAQSAISEGVAKALGFRWEMVPYTEAAWRKWFHSEASEAYARYAHNLVSIPHYQDWPAIWELKRRGLLSGDAVVAPGHLGDFAAGSHVPPMLLDARKFTRRQIIHMIFHAHYNLWSLQDTAMRETLLRRVDRLLPPGETFGVEAAAVAMDEWDWAERQSKFICNSVRAYEFWGVDWWMPLADAEILEFWTTVPLRLRVRQRLYVLFVTRLYAQVAGIPFRRAQERDGARFVQRAVDQALKIGCYRFARKAYRAIVAPIVRARTNNDAYERDPLAWYGIMDKEIFRREFSGNENFHSFVSRHILGDLTF